MKAGRSRIAARRAGLLWLPILALTACDRSDKGESGNIVVPARPAAVAASPLPPVSASAPAPGIPDRVERVSAPAPAPTPDHAPPPMRPRKTFNDPPLPAELNDDGGLEPLPPRPR